MRGSADWVATFLECRTRDLPVENLSPCNNTVALALSGCVTPGNGSCTCPCLFVFRLLSLHALRASLRERGRVRIIMALRVLTLHLLSQLVIHISPHVPLSPVPSLTFFSSNTSVLDISYIVIRSLCSIYRTYVREGVARIPSKNLVRNYTSE